MDLFGNTTSQLPPWLTNTPSPSSIVDKAFQARNQEIRNFTDLAQLQMQQRQQEALLPLKVQDQRNQIANAALDIQGKQLAQENLISSKGGIVDLATRLADTTDWASPDSVANVWKSVAANPSIALTPSGQQLIAKAEAMHSVSVTANTRIAQAEARAAAMEAVQGMRSETAEGIADKKIKAGGAVRPTAAMQNAKAIQDARTALADAEASGDPDEIKQASTNLNDFLSVAKIKTGSDLSPYLHRLWQTQASAIGADQTLTTDQKAQKSELQYQKFLKIHGLSDNAQAAPKVAPTAPTKPDVHAQPTFSTQDDVIQAFKSGKISRDAAATILNKQFGIPLK